MLSHDSQDSERFTLEGQFGAEPTRGRTVEGESENKSLPGDDIGCGPGVARALSQWGAVVAFRAGIVAKIDLRRRAAHSVAPVRMDPDGWKLQQDWRRFAEGRLLTLGDGSVVTSRIRGQYPKGVEFLPWVKALSLRDGDGAASAAFRGPGDLTALRLDYITVSRLLTSERHYVRGSRRVQRVLTWMFAVSHYLDQEMTLEDWCHREPSIASEAARDAITRELRLWCHGAARRLGGGDRYGP